MAGGFGIGWDGMDAGTTGMDGIGSNTSNPSYGRRELEDGFDTGWVHAIALEEKEGRQ